MVYTKWLEKDKGGHHFGGTESSVYKLLLQKLLSTLVTFFFLLVINFDFNLLFHFFHSNLVQG
jgi:hypothetical protein